MPQIDFNSEAADTWLETVRLAQEKQAEDRLYYRPAVNEYERDMAGAVRRRLSRRVYGATPLGPSPRPRRVARESSAAPACAVCGGRHGLRVKRQIWPAGSLVPVNIYRCADCAA